MKNHFLFPLVRPVFRALRLCRLAVCLLCSVLFFSSCEKVLMTRDIQPSAVATFDYLWNRFDQQYSMFDVKDVDWNQLYDSLRPQVYDGMSSDSLFAICSALLNPLQDGHVNLYANYDVARADSLYYRFYSESGMDINAIVLNYLGINYHSTGGLAHGALCDGRVIYVRYGSFSNTVTTTQLRHIVNLYPDARGMVLDLRGNGGGSLSNVHRLLTIMPSHGQPLYTSQIKSGPNHDDFTAPVTTYAPVVPDSLAFHHPVYVLIDCGCFSATSTFAIATQAYDNITLLGEATSGGMGLPTMGYLPNGWRYRHSVTRTIALDGHNYENGVPPDIPVRFDLRAAQLRGTDNLIDTACALILAAGKNCPGIRK